MGLEPTTTSLGTGAKLRCVNNADVITVHSYRRGYQRLTQTSIFEPHGSHLDRRMRRRLRHFAAKALRWDPPGVGQRLERHARGARAAATNRRTAAGSHDHAFECPELGNASPDVLDVGLSDLARFATGAVAILDNREECSYDLDRESELTATTDEGDALHVPVVVAPRRWARVPARRDGRFSCVCEGDVPFSF